MPTGKPQDLRAEFTPRGTSRNLRTAAGTLKPKCTPGLSLPWGVRTIGEHAAPPFPRVFDKSDAFGSCRVLSHHGPPRWGREVSLTSANSCPGQRGELKGRAERRKSQSLAKKSTRLLHILALCAGLPWTLLYFKHQGGPSPAGHVPLTAENTSPRGAAAHSPARGLFPFSRPAIAEAQRLPWENLRGGPVVRFLILLGAVDELRGQQGVFLTQLQWLRP